MGRDGSERKCRKRPAVEWAVGSVSLIVTLALIGFVGWQAFQSPGQPPRVEVRATGIIPNGDSYLVEIVAANRSGQTAAGLVIEGTLNAAGGGEPEKSTLTLDYVPGNSEARGGLFFTSNPAVGDLQIRALGYKEP